MEIAILYGHWIVCCVRGVVVEVCFVEGGEFDGDGGVGVAERYLGEGEGGFVGVREGVLDCAFVGAGGDGEGGDGGVVGEDEGEGGESCEEESSEMHFELGVVRGSGSGRKREETSSKGELKSLHIRSTQPEELVRR